MGYLISIAHRAERDLVSLFEEIDAAHSDVAMKWYMGLIKSIRTLGNLPNRCSAAPENPQFRHLFYGRTNSVYRVIFRVSEKQKRVEVLHIRHGARREPEASDLG
jgi:plasmid stabilization system protein ParE